MGERSHIIACVWDFDRTLIPGNMQVPMFAEYGIDERFFWQTINQFTDRMQRRGVYLSGTLAYLNFVLALVQQGRLPGLSKSHLKEYGQQLTYFPGVPEIFSLLRNDVEQDPCFRSYSISLEHYVVSSGHIEIIRGSQVALHMEAIFASEFLEGEIDALAEKFQFGSIATELVDSSSGVSKAYNSVENLEEFLADDPPEATVELQEGDKKVIRQIACVVDHTQKTRCLFEINKGCNKNRAIDVNAVIESDVRRIPFQNMIYIADGPSDVPAFSVIRGHGGKAFAVYNPEDEREFEQNDRMLAAGRIDAYGPADYREGSSTTRWLRMHLKKIAQRIVDEECRAAEDNPGKPPEHLH
ncbi:MAG: haloacid dehalogenase-like hydrolase [Opitutales bacterium]|nr:haloacid dehalogenase-like hydrolase [Opitutales bacterium]